MDIFHRGLQAYLVGLALVATITGIWGVNRFLLANSTAGTGWPLMIGGAGVLVFLGIGVWYYRSRSTNDESPGPFPWTRKE